MSILATVVIAIVIFLAAALFGAGRKVLLSVTTGIAVAGAGAVWYGSHGLTPKGVVGLTLFALLSIVGTAVINGLANMQSLGYSSKLRNCVIVGTYAGILTLAGCPPLESIGSSAALMLVLISWVSMLETASDSSADTDWLDVARDVCFFGMLMFISALATYGAVYFTLPVGLTVSPLVMVITLAIFVVSIIVAALMYCFRNSEVIKSMPATCFVVGSIAVMSVLFWSNPFVNLGWLVCLICAIVLDCMNRTSSENPDEDVAAPVETPSVDVQDSSDRDVGCYPAVDAVEPRIEKMIESHFENYCNENGITGKIREITSEDPVGQGSSNKVLMAAAVISIVFLSGCGPMLHSFTNAVAPQKTEKVVYLDVVVDHAPYKCVSMPERFEHFVCQNAKTGKTDIRLQRN